MGVFRRMTPRAVALAAAAAVVGAPPARAEEGLETGASTRYVLDAARTTVRGTVTLDLRNVTPSRSTSGGVVFYYFDSYTVPVPAGAENVRAESGGRRLGVSLRRTDDPSTRLAEVSFPRLTYGQRRQVVLTFDAPGEAPRSADGTRVGPGYATFAVYGFGDAGRNRVEVVAPAAMTFDSTRDDFESATTGATATHTLTAVDDGGGSWAVVSLRDPEQVEEQPVSVSGTDVLLVGYPDDPKWLDFTSTKVAAGIPALERLVGTDWPGGLQRIREDPTPSVRGFDGWFDPGGDEIVVGEALDDDLLLHELSHAWVNGERFEGRWIYEGLAQLLAERAVRATGGEVAARQTVSRRSDGAVPLLDWGGSADGRARDVDDYGYPASLAAMSALLGDVDDTRLAAVLAAAAAGEGAYDAPGSRGGARTTWQRLLDLAESRGGVADGAAVYRTWVVDAEGAALLGPREQARAAYAEVDAADGAWLPPQGLRGAMTEWAFDRAATARAAVTPLGEAARQVQVAADRSGIDVPDPVRGSYEEADDPTEYAALATSLPRAAAALTAVGTARDAAGEDRDPVSGLGADLLGVAERAAEAESLLARGDVGAATGRASSANERAGLAPLAGAAAVLGALSALAALVLLARGWWRARRSEQPQHPGVAEGVGLDPLQVEELRDPLVVGAQQLGVHGGVDRLALDRREPVPAEEAGLEGQAEQPRQPEPACPLDEPLEDRRAHPSAQG